MFNIMHYINDTDFQIVYINNELNIINYDKINYMENEKISLSYKNNPIVIIGKNLRAKKLLDNEIIIIGDINSLEFKR